MKEIIKQMINEELSDSSRYLTKKVLPEFDVTKMNINIWKSKGLTPYIVDINDNEIHLEEVTGPIRQSIKDGMNVRQVYLLTEEEFQKFDKIAAHIEKIVGMCEHQIKLMHELYQSKLSEIASNGVQPTKSSENQASTE